MALVGAVVVDSSAWWRYLGLVAPMTTADVLAHLQALQRGARTQRLEAPNESERQYQLGRETALETAILLLEEIDE